MTNIILAAATIHPELSEASMMFDKFKSNKYMLDTLSGLALTLTKYLDFDVWCLI